MSTDAHPQRLPTRPALSEDAWRQAQRIALGSVIGLAVVKVMSWPFGVFFAVYPILLLGLVPVFNLRLVAQFIASSVLSLFMSNLLGVLGEVSPGLAIIVFFVFAAYCFGLMARGPWFLFGALSIVSTSLMVHLASYPQIRTDDLYTAQFIATLLAAFIAAVAHALLPERRTMPVPTGTKPPNLIRHQTLLGATCATLSYIAFQVIDLSDSLSAQAATVLVLFPMTLAGGRRAAWTRVVGAVLGSMFALAVQLLLYTHATHLVFLLALYAAGMGLFATLHVRENAGPAVGFSAATAIAVLLGQLMPGSDLYRVSLYRVSSVAVAVVATLLCMFITQAVLNRFASTRAAT